jgi:hypothetical protein
LQGSPILLALDRKERRQQEDVPLLPDVLADFGFSPARLDCAIGLSISADA